MARKVLELIINNAKRKTLLGIALGFLVIPDVFANPLHTSTASKPCRLLVLGDSLSAAYGLRRDQGWVAMLTISLGSQAANPPLPSCEVINRSVSGETTAGGLSRLPSLLKEDQPSHVLIILGANDGLRGQATTDMAKRLEQMISLSRAAQARPLLIGMRIPPNYGPRYSEAFEQTFKTVAEKTGTPRLPFLLEPIAGDRQAFQDDGLHPNAQAQPKIHDHVLQFLKRFLKLAYS